MKKEKTKVSKLYIIQREFLNNIILKIKNNNFQ